MEIFIAGHKDSESPLQKLIALQPGEFDALVITDVDTPYPDFINDLVKDRHWLCFDDVTLSHGNYQAPTRENIQEGLEWAAKKKRDKLVVACHAGISRSSALAMLIAYQDHGDVEKAISLWNPRLHWPNPLIVKLGCEILEAPLLWNRYTLFNLEKLRIFEDPDFQLSDTQL